MYTSFRKSSPSPYLGFSGKSRNTDMSKISLSLTKEIFLGNGRGRRFQVMEQVQGLAHGLQGSRLGLNQFATAVSGVWGQPSGLRPPIP